jgi:hypothetical protein
MSHLLAQIDLKERFFQNANVGGETSLYSLISRVLPNAYIIAGIILFIYISAGGFMIISSAGNPEAAKNGQKIVTNAIIGFIVLFASYWLIQIIEVITGVKIFNPNLTF